MKAARWWYRRPRKGWGLRDLLVPCIKYFKCGDEFCNDTLFIRIPLLGHITTRLNRYIRVNNKCDKCVAEYGPWCQGCEDCHHGPRCHDWLSCGHEGNFLRCPACGGCYCTTCELDPKKSCPYRGTPT